MLAYPEAEVYWYFLGSNASGPDLPLDTKENRMQNFRKGALVIQDLRRNDTGWYRCFAKNAVGNHSSMMHLRVKGNTGELFSYSLSEVHPEFADLFGVGPIGI